MLDSLQASRGRGIGRLRIRKNFSNFKWFQVPERVLRTVRVSITMKEAMSIIRVKIGILVMGIDLQGFEHIRCVKTRNYFFSADDQVVNFDDIIDHDDLVTRKPRSHFLSGDDRESFKILVTITPLAHNSCLSVT